MILDWATPPALEDKDALVVDASVDAWRWQDLENDSALRLDMTDRGFNWTRKELDEAARIANLSSSLTETITDKNIDRLATTAGLD